MKIIVKIQLYLNIYYLKFKTSKMQLYLKFLNYPGLTKLGHFILSGLFSGNQVRYNKFSINFHALFEILVLFQF